MQSSSSNSSADNQPAILVPNVNRFRFSAYWWTWNRIIATCGMNTIELDLTPINSHNSLNWQRTKQEVFRCHGTFVQASELHSELPKNILAAMVGNYGAVIVRRMLSFDYLTVVDWQAIELANKNSNGGGVPLQAILDIRDGKINYWHNE